MNLNFQKCQRNRQRLKVNPCRALVYRDLRCHDVVPPVPAFCFAECQIPDPHDLKNRSEFYPRVKAGKASNTESTRSSITEKEIGIFLLA